MIRQLLRRDPLLGHLDVLLKVILAGTLLSNGIGLWSNLAAARGGVPGLEPGSLAFGVNAAVSWLILAIVLLVLKANVRCSPFDLTLPVPPRVLWLTRTLVTLSATLLSLGVMTLALWGIHQAVHVPASVRHAVHIMNLYMAGGAILAVALVQSHQPQLSELRLDRRFLGFFALATLGTLAVILILSALFPTLWAFPALAGLVILWVTYRSLPASFSLHPREALDEAIPRRDAATAETEAGRAWAGPARGLLWLTTVRTMYSMEGRMAWALLVPPMLAVYGIMMGAEALTFGVIQTPWVWVLALLFLVLPLSQMHALDHLPIPRKRLLPWIVLPALIIPIVSYISAQAVAEARSNRKSLVSCGTEEKDGRTARCVVQVPGIYWRVAWNGVPPMQSSPAGESHQPPPLPVARGTRVAVYSPFSTPRGASPEFVAWQLGRAIETVYGARIPADELIARYLRRGPDGGAEWSRPEIDLLRDYPQLHPRSRLQNLPIGTALIGFPMLVLMAWLMGPLAAARDEAKRRKLSLLLVSGPLVLGAGFIGGDFAKVFDVTALARLTEALARRPTEWIPGHEVTLWLLAAILLAIGGAIAGRAFQKLEVPISREVR